ncbi:MAG TPA: hypothetical protein VFK85_11590, partial [Anaeromyxobacteraceae bacterium]|nr:hypothetical protein [Anaeromyxobacteraceae bacterium]
SDLEVVARSEPLPIGVVAIVDGRVAPPAWSRIAAALRELPGAPQGAAALAAIRLERFVPLDEPSLALARKRFAEAAR